MDFDLKILFRVRSTKALEINFKSTLREQIGRQF